MLSTNNRLFKPASLAPGATYGVKTSVDSSEAAGILINPPKPSEFQEALKTARLPVLKSTAAADAHRAKLVSSGVAFGEPSEHGGTAAECVHPEVAEDQLEADELARSTLYLKTHGAYLPGEQVERGYDGDFDKTAVCGVPTPQDTRGGGVAKTLRWTSSAQATPLVTAAQRRHIDGPAKPAAVQDPDTVFGIVTRPIGDTVDALITTAGPAEDSSALRDRVQSTLRPPTIASLGYLEDAFEAADEAHTGAVPEDVARELCTAHLPELGPRAVTELLEASAAEPGMVDWITLMETVRPPMVPTLVDTMPCGTATIRTDLPPPKFVSVTEQRNFGNQGNAGLMVNPSVYTTRGLSEKSVVGGKTKAELELIFKTAGLQGTHDFEEVWAKATAVSKSSELVSVEVFQQALM